MSFGEIARAFINGERGFLLQITDYVYAVCCCRQIHKETSSVSVIVDEANEAVMMFPGGWKTGIYRLDKAIGELYPLSAHSVFGFSLGDVISDCDRFFMRYNTGSDIMSESPRIPKYIDELEIFVARKYADGCPRDNRYAVTFEPPLPRQYTDLKCTSDVFAVYNRARQTSKYVGLCVRNPEVGQLVARNVDSRCYVLAVIVHVTEKTVILRDGTDYAKRRIIYEWGEDPEYPHSDIFLDHFLKIRRLDWWMTASCKCVPMLPHRYSRDWAQWPKSELLHLSDGTSEFPSEPTCFTIGDRVEIWPDNTDPLTFSDIARAFRNGERVVLIRVLEDLLEALVRETKCIYTVCCCRKINENDSSVEIIIDEGKPAVKMFPESGQPIFRLDETIGKLYPLSELSVHGFSLGDVISDCGKKYLWCADGLDPTSETPYFPCDYEEEKASLERICISDGSEAGSTQTYSPPLPDQYVKLPKFSPVFVMYNRARQVSKYVGNPVAEPEVGQLVARRVYGSMYKLAVVVHVNKLMQRVIVRDNVDYAVRRMEYQYGIDENWTSPPVMYYPYISEIRRLDWWMKTSCKCVPMHPHRQELDWRQWPRGELLFRTDGSGGESLVDLLTGTH
jgi:hypothetical protein